MARLLAPNQTTDARFCDNCIKIQEQDQDKKQYAQATFLTKLVSALIFVHPKTLKIWLLTYTLKVRQFYLNWGITSTEVPLYSESAQGTFDPGTQFYLGLVICHG